MDKIRISNAQLGLLVFGFLYGNTPISNPSLGAKRDAWIAVILGWIVGILLITIHLFVAKLNKGKNLVGILESCFGKVLGKLICLLYSLHFLHIAALNVRGSSEFMSKVTYDDAPLYVLMGVVMLFVVCIVKSGLETAGRLTEIFVPIIPISLIFIAFSIITVNDFSGFQPVLLKIGPVVKSAASSVSIVYGDFIVFLMILPYTNDEKGRSKSVYITMAVLGLVFLLITIRDTLIIGPGLFENIPYPSHVASIMIPILNIGPLIDINLLLGGGFKIIIHLYAGIKIIAELFNIKNYKPLVSAFAVFVFVVAFWVFPNDIEGGKWLNSISVIIYCLPFQTIFPIVMLIISMVKRYEKTESKV